MALIDPWAAQVCKQSGEMLLTAKAFNGRCITEWLAFDLLEASRNVPLADHRIPAMCICVFPGRCWFAISLITTICHVIQVQISLRALADNAPDATSEGVIGPLVWPHWKVSAVSESGLQIDQLVEVRMLDWCFSTLARLLRARRCNLQSQDHAASRTCVPRRYAILWVVPPSEPCVLWATRPWLNPKRSYPDLMIGCCLQVGRYEFMRCWLQRL